MQKVAEASPMAEAHHHVEMEARTWWSQLYNFTDRDCFKLVCDLKSELIIMCFSVLPHLGGTSKLRARKVSHEEG
jgi:hypothetical protein